jgi:hypothetical protein
MLVFFQLTLKVTVPEFIARLDTVTPFCANNTPPPPSPLPRRGSNNKARRIIHILTPDPFPSGEGSILFLAQRERGLGGEEGLWCFFLKIFGFIFLI